MRRIADVVRLSLGWTQPSAFKMEYELSAGDVVVGKLHFRSSFGSFATARSADGAWTFKRVGFWQTRVTIRKLDSEDEIATFRNNTWSGGGTLELPDGRRYRATTNLWQSKLEFQDDLGKPLVGMKSRGLLHLSADVEIEPSAASIPELSYIVLLGWYLVVMMHSDSTAGSAAAAAG